MTTGPDGSLMTFDERMAEVRDALRRRSLRDAGPRSPAWPSGVAAVERAQAWLASVGLAGQV